MCRRGSIRLPLRSNLVTHLDAWLPEYEFDEHHELLVHAPLATVRQVLGEIDVGRIPLVAALMTLRRLPAFLVSPRQTLEARRRPSDQRRGLTALTGFTLLTDETNEVVLGLTGRFWKLRGEILKSDPATFRDAPPAGSARAVMNFRLEPESAERTRVSTDTRIHCADLATRRTFGWYWRLIRPGSGLIRIAMLREVRRAAEEK